MAMTDILIIEPFYGGSHAQLIDVLSSDPVIGPRLKIYSLPAKKWHWRARTSALHFYETIQSSSSYRVLFSSSVLNLPELLALRPDLRELWKVVYFHENQLVYPVRKHQDRDFHYGYAQIITSLVADAIVFNSEFNKESFLKSISSHLKLMPDYRPKDLEAKIRPKCHVIYFPIDFSQDRSTGCNSSNCVYSDSETSDNGVNMDPNSNLDSLTTLPVETPLIENERSVQALQIDSQQECGLLIESQSKSKEKKDSIQFELLSSPRSSSRLHIVWPHRWEHDKNPEMFFQVLFQLLEEDYDFSVSVLGESYLDIPEIFHEAKQRLQDRIVAWGFQQSREDYRKVLDSAHVAVSTANHEFFGVSMLESASRGCFLLCPKRLVYPEIYPEEFLYSTQTQLLKALRKFCKRPDKIPNVQIDLDRFSWKSLQTKYKEILKI